MDRSTQKVNQGFGERGARIGKSVVIKGELWAHEDLYLDGQVEGTIDLGDHHLMVGPNGRAQINVSAKEVVILGSVMGKVRAVDRIEMRKTCSVMGDLVTGRLIIEEGAYFKGTIDIPGGGEVAADPSELGKVDSADSLPLGEISST